VPSFEITLRVQDLLGELDEAVLHVTVENVNDPPTFIGVGELTYDQNEYISFYLQAVDPDLGLDLPEPETLTFSGHGREELIPDAAGLIELVPDQSMVGEHEMTYTVTDRDGLNDVIVVRWVIVDVNDAPVITTEVEETVPTDEDAEFNLRFEAVDIDGDDLEWSDDALLFDIDPTSGAVSFTPLQDEVGVHTVTVTVSDGRGGTGTLTFDLEVVNVNDDPMIISVVPDGGTVDAGEEVIYTATATDEDGDALTYTWRLGDRVLGTGTSLSSSKLDTGSHKVILEVTDPHGGSDLHEMDVELRSSLGTSLLIPLAIILLIAVLGVAALYMRARNRSAREEEEVPLDDEREDVETEPEPSIEKQVIKSAEVFEYETEGAPSGPEAPDEVSDLYDLENADEFRPK
jgi:hypothetical protein